MESKKINQLATELTPSLDDLTIIGDPSTGISKKITLSQMAALFTGTVEEYASLAAFPLVGVADTIYIATDTNILYRWSTSLNAYVELSPNIISSLVFNDSNGFDGTISLVGSTATLTITTTLTSGSVAFGGASGALSQDNTNFYWDNSNKRLGINTNAPTVALDAFGSGIIGRVNGTSTNNAFLGFASSGTNKWSIGNVQSDHRFRIYNEATTSELVSILQTGEFGIGIANPTTKFHIDGAASALIVNLDANVSIAKSISFRSDNSNRWNIEVSGTESTSNAGMDFFLRSYSDAGALIETPLSIVRSTGVTTIKSLTLTNALSAANGGTGITSYTIGDLIYASGSTTLAKLADVATGNALISGGVGVAPSWGKIDLTTTITGTLPVANGGTGATTFTAGRVLFGNGTSAINTSANLFWDNTNSRLGIQTATPSVALHVVGAGLFSSTITSSNEHIALNSYGFKSYSGASATGDNISFGTGIYSTFDGIYQSSGSTKDFGIWTNGGTINEPKFAIKNSGNIGINTTNPDFGSYGAGEKILGISNTSARARLQFQNTSTGTTGVSGTIAFFNSTTLLASMDVIADGATNIGRWVFNTNNGSSFSERMRISNTGNILFSNPNSGNSVSTGNVTLMSTATAINDRLTIAFAQTGVNSRARAGIGSVSETTDGYLGALAFYTRAANDGSALDTSNERMRITSGGNVLIGTTTDAGEKLKVNGNTISNIYYLDEKHVAYTKYRDTIGVSTTRTYTFSCSDTDNAAMAEITVTSNTSNRGFSIAKFIVGGQIGAASSTNYSVHEVVRQNNAGSLGTSFSTISAITKANGSFSFTIQNGWGGGQATVIIEMKLMSWGATSLTYSVS